MVAGEWFKTSNSMPVLGSHEQPARNDLADAALVADVANAFGRWRQAHDGKLGSLKPFREAVWFYWQQPRLPRPLIRGKYPAAVPWSPAARMAYWGNPKHPSGLVIEHSRPMDVLLRELLDAAPVSPESALRMLGEPPTYAVVTDEESRALGNAEWHGSDPLRKYADAGLDVSGFRPLSEEL